MSTSKKPQVVQYDIGETFGINDAKGAMIDGLSDVGDPSVPKKIENYVFRKELVSDIMAWMKIGSGEGLFLTGPTGSGKTSGVTQVFARLNQPVQRATGHSMMELADLVSEKTVIDGDIVSIDGPLTTAMRLGQPFILDEVDDLKPGVAVGLHSVVEEGFLSIPDNGGEIVKAQRGFCVIATGNTAGNGDRTGLYQGTMRQNAAFMDRFWVVEVGYPDKAQEAPIIGKVAPGLPDWVRDAMIDMANEVRALFIGEAEGPQIEMPMSTRTLV